MAIRFETGGSIKIIEPAEFSREFGVVYARELILPDDLPKNFLHLCNQYEYPPKPLSLGRIPAFIKKVGGAVGYGLYAERDLPAGAIIGEYSGVLSKDWKPLHRGGRLNPYLLKYPFHSPYAIDAEKRGNELRFMNHSSSQANAARRYIRSKGVLRVIFAAEKAIPKGGQILIDYGSDYWRGARPVALKP